MANTVKITASYPYTVSSGSGTATVKYIDFVLTCSLSSTNTTTTLTFNTIRATKPSDFSGSNPSCTVISDGKVIVQAVPGYNYTFSDKTSSWSRGTSDATKVVNFTVSGPNGGSTGSANITVPKLPTYAVKYNANGGAGAPSQQTKYYGKALVLSSSKPTRTNYVFKNWNTASGGTGTSYNPGGSYTANAAATLYAQWYAPYTVTYNANGGANGPSSQIKVYNKPLALTTSTPTRTGYAFVKWNTNSSGTGTSYNPGDTYSANANITLYAIWAPMPSISSLSVIRCDASGNYDDEGTRAEVKCVWSCVSNATIYGTYTAQTGGDTWSFTFSSGSSGSGTVTSTTLIGGTLDVDMQYTVKVIVTCTTGDVTKSTSRSALLTRAFFTLDFKAGGKSVGIGRAAPRDGGLDVGFPTVFDQTVETYGAITSHGSIFTKTDAIDVDGDLPSALQYSRWFQCNDKDDDRLAVFGAARELDGRVRGFFYAYNKNSAGSLVNNHMNFYVDKSGNCSYGLSDPGAFREALRMRSGVVSARSVSAGSSTSVNVTFSPALSSAPNVVCGLQSTQTQLMGNCSCVVTETSATGFTVALVNNSTSSRNLGCYWIAM